jgi:hypothetical protein
MASAAARQLHMDAFPVGMAGGLLIDDLYRKLVSEKLHAEGATQVQVVPEPVAGSVTLACRLLTE